MKKINIHEAKTHLSRLVDEAAKGKPFIIAKAGKPMVKVVAINEAAPKKVKRLNAMPGVFTIPDDFDTRHQEEIEKMFYGEDE
ncbi:Prevent-host-death protein [Candidatus Koribacter versatilis Ellin345]|uniref:Antitoxin n=1 Tax=Koribacter versatilis (strain Ellin345) TaxID=204669 RepID=Q1IT03_KORVE|nr:type II toxin-antitoxin system prevent-host-death family antitoxin [Candidatus Koribacter versatilis]ABF39997.1 Prevent-host-death protein [Candidatus Koribacter versatilis Ellin345]